MDQLIRSRPRAVGSLSSGAARTDTAPGRSTGAIEVSVLKWMSAPALGVAGWASLQAPPPWSWMGCLAAVVGVGAVWWAEHERRRRERARRRRVDDLEAERARLGRREELHAALLGALPVGILAVRSGIPVYANRAAAEFLGRRVAEVGAPLPNAVRQVIEEAVGGIPSSARFDQGYPRRVLEVTAHPPGGDGLIVLHLVDITERRRADRVRQDFVAAASHELKTPVAAIRAAAETVLVAWDDDPDVAFDFSGRIFDNAHRMSRIVDNLLDLSRLESDELRVAPFDLADVLGEVVERFGASLPPVEYEAAPTPVVANPSDLALALRNLLENAVRHTPEDGWVRVSVAVQDGEATVTVADGGAGIPAADLPRIFERFYRVDAARSRATGGTGLGLAIVKHVADLHRGRVEARSRLGEGSVFRIRIPVLPPDPGS